MPQAHGLGRFLQQPTPRERAARGLTAGADVPTRIGPGRVQHPGRALPARSPGGGHAALEAAIRRTSDHG